MNRKKTSPVHPGEILLENFFEPLGISQDRVANELNVPPRRIYEIIQGQRFINADIARRLAHFFGLSERYWLDLQARYDGKREGKSPTEFGNKQRHIQIRKRGLDFCEVNMAQDSAIEWTDATWNPVTGCTKISPGCKNCYAHRMARRLHAMGQARYKNNFAVTLHTDLLEQPLRWSQPRKIFVNSMSDLFHADVPVEFIRRAFNVMGKADWHTFQILTKRSERLVELAGRLPWHDNIWMGVSVESADHTYRIEHLRKVPAAVRFLSVEPLLGPIPRLPLQRIHWVIVGGESGPGARVMDPRWVRKIRDRCIAQCVPFFFKQWGGTRKKQTGRELDGRTWDEMPEIDSKGSKRVLG